MPVRSCHTISSGSNRSGTHGGATRQAGDYRKSVGPREATTKASDDEEHHLVTTGTGKDGPHVSAKRESQSGDAHERGQAVHEGQEHRTVSVKGDGVEKGQQEGTRPATAGRT